MCGFEVKAHGDTTGSFGNIDLLLSNGDGTLQSANAVVGMPPMDVSGHASCQGNQFAMGRHAITAVYSGDANFVGSTSPATTFYRHARPR